MTLLHRLLTKFNLNENTCFQVSRQPSTIQPEHVWVIGKLDTPTFDFYFRSRKEHFVNYTEISTHRLPDKNHPIWHTNNSLIILVRDVPYLFLDKLAKTLTPNRKIVWFLDDDIIGANKDNSLPIPYRKRLHQWYSQSKNLLEYICSDIWVSTPYLAKLYHLSLEKVLPPRSPIEKKMSHIRCFYHGSSSHTLEWNFVIELINEIQQKYTNISFELIGDFQLYRQVKHIPRVNVLHPMSWSNYQSFISSRTVDIGLAPLMASTFNLARSHTKFIDINRQQAIGIFSSRFPLAKQISDYQAGFIAEDTINSWLDIFSQAIIANKELINKNSDKLITDLSAQDTKLPTLY